MPNEHPAAKPTTATHASQSPPASPRWIRWAGHFALALLLLIPVAVLLARSGAWQPGLALYALALLGSTLLLIVFIILLLVPRYSSWRSDILRRAAIALPGAALLIAMTQGAGNAPQIHDITTDTNDPPTFIKAVQQRGEESNTLAIKPDFIEQQRAAYPDLKSIATTLNTKAAFDRAVVVAQQLGWEIYNQDREGGLIEAVETTAIFAFKDDIAIRVRPSGAGATVDLRSVSRVGRGDLGANAARIRRFQDAFTAVADAG